MTNRAPLLMAPLMAAWLLMSAFIDFAVVPFVFSEVSNFFEAGAVGIGLFSKFNLLEMVLAIILVFLGLLYERKNILFPLTLILLLIAFVYNFYLSGQITYYSHLMEKSQLTPAYDTYFGKQKFFHHIYIAVDTLKMLALLIGWSYMIWRKEKGEE